MEGRRAAADAHREIGFAVSGPLPLEVGQVGSQGEARAREAVLERCSELAGDRRVPTGYVLGGMTHEEPVEVANGAGG